MSAHTFTAAVAAREIDGRYVAGADHLRTDGVAPMFSLVDRIVGWLIRGSGRA